MRSVAPVVIQFLFRWRRGLWDDLEDIARRPPYADALVAGLFHDQRPFAPMQARRELGPRDESPLLAHLPAKLKVTISEHQATKRPRKQCDTSAIHEVEYQRRPPEAGAFVLGSSILRKGHGCLAPTSTCPRGCPCGTSAGASTRTEWRRKMPDVGHVFWPRLASRSSGKKWTYRPRLKRSPRSLTRGFKLRGQRAMAAGRACRTERPRESTKKRG